MLGMKGIAAREIRGKHLEYIYGGLNRIPDAPDFSAIGSILAKAGRDTADPAIPLAGVIIETRKHALLAFVVDCFVRATGAPVQLYHGNGNLGFIRDTAIAGLVGDGKVVLTPLNATIIDARCYNALLLSRKFWQSVIGRRKILVFQTDSIACAASKYTIADFMKFDYIGSKWKRKRPVGITIDGGNGGLSLRDWRRMVDCIERFPPERWVGGEDGYFAFHIDLMGGRVARPGESARFSTQEEYACNSFGAHRITDLQRNNRAELQRFLKYCPDAGRMLP